MTCDFSLPSFEEEPRENANHTSAPLSSLSLPLLSGRHRTRSAPAVTVHAGSSVPAAGVVQARQSPLQGVSFHLRLNENMNWVLDSSLFGIIPLVNSSEWARQPYVPEHSDGSVCWMWREEDGSLNGQSIVTWK